VVERGFAHTCETGGGRRSWLRGIDEVRKRHLMTATVHNLGLVLRKLLGSGKVRQFAAMLSRVSVAVNAPIGLIRTFRHFTPTCSRLVSPISQNSTAHFLTA